MSTIRMTAGDLGARAPVAQRDEFGLLAGSFNSMAQQVQDTVIMLRRFVADAAHEINTPLTALRTNLELASGAGQADASRYLAHALAQVERVHRLASGLLDLSRIEAWPGDASGHVPVDMTALAQQLGEGYASQAEQAGLYFSIDLPERRSGCRAMSGS